MNREEAIFYIKELQKTYASMDKKVAEAVDMAIDALSQPIVCKDYHIDDDHIYCSTKMADRVVKALQDRPTGEWIEAELDKGFRVCSVCKNKNYKDKMAWRTDFIKSYLNFCPNCGAKMKGGVE